jgi:hypothetical protein
MKPIAVFHCAFERSVEVVAIVTSSTQADGRRGWPGQVGVRPRPDVPTCSNPSRF